MSSGASSNSKMSMSSVSGSSGSKVQEVVEHVRGQRLSEAVAAGAALLNNSSSSTSSSTSTDEATQEALWGALSEYFVSSGGDENAATVAGALGVPLARRRVLVFGTPCTALVTLLVSLLDQDKQKDNDDGGCVVTYLRTRNPNPNAPVDPCVSKLVELEGRPGYTQQEVDPRHLTAVALQGTLAQAYVFPLASSTAEVQEWEESGSDLWACMQPEVMQALLGLCGSKGARMVLVSSTGVYGDVYDGFSQIALSGMASADANGYTLSVPEEFRGYTSAYGSQSAYVESARTSEAWVSTGSRELGVDVIIARIGVCVGTQAWQSGALANGTVLGDLLAQVPSVVAQSDDDTAVPTLYLDTFDYASKDPSCNAYRTVSVSCVDAVVRRLRWLAEAYAPVYQRGKPLSVNFEQHRVFNVASADHVVALDDFAKCVWDACNAGALAERVADAFTEPGYMDPLYVTADTSRLETHVAGAKLAGTAVMQGQDKEADEEKVLDVLRTLVQTMAEMQPEALDALSKSVEVLPDGADTVVQVTHLDEDKTAFVVGAVEVPAAAGSSSNSNKRFPGRGALEIDGDKKLVVLLGGAGFLCTHLTRRLLSDGYQVIAIDNLAAGIDENVRRFYTQERWRKNYQFINFDVSQPWKFAEDLQVFAIYQGASLASPEFYYKDMVGTLRSGLQATRLAMEQAMAKGARVFFTSTSECYGDPLAHPQVKTYLGNVNITGKRSQYDQSKRFGETLLRCALKRGCDVRISRIFNTYGQYMRPDDGRVITNFVHQALTGKPMTVYGSGKQTRSFTYVADQIEGQMSLLTCDESVFPGPELLDRVYNIGNDTTEIDMVELAVYVKQVLEPMIGREVRYIHTHWADVRASNLAKEEADALADELNDKEGPGADGEKLFIVTADNDHEDRFLVVKDEYDKFDPQRRKADAKETKAVLGWKGAVVPVELGIERLVQYFLAMQPVILKGLDGARRVYDYQALLASKGLCVQKDYLLGKLAEAKGLQVDILEAEFLWSQYQAWWVKEDSRADDLATWRTALENAPADVFADGVREEMLEWCA